MSIRYSDIDVMTCVQGNTARKAELYRSSGSCDLKSNSKSGRRNLSVEHDRCVVYDFRRATAASGRSVSETGARTGRANSVSRRAGKYSSANRNTAGKRAARARARKMFVLRTALFAVLVMVTMFGIGGIASKAKSREVPSAYKYYDTITVGYQENLLDIVERYDDRDHYETQMDYVEELCRINNLAFDGTAYPTVTPGTHLVVPYYSTELK